MAHGLSEFEDYGPQSTGTLTSCTSRLPCCRSTGQQQTERTKPLAWIVLVELHHWASVSCYRWASAACYRYVAHTGLLKKNLLKVRSQGETNFLHEAFVTNGVFFPFLLIQKQAPLDISGKANVTVVSQEGRENSSFGVIAKKTKGGFVALSTPQKGYPLGIC